MRSSPVRLLLVAVLATLVSLVTTADAAVGSWQLKSREAQEVSGAWHIYAKIELPKAPLTAHQTMRFVFTKTMVYERSLIDGHAEPVINRQSLTGQSPSTESLDVNFSDATGKIFKGTNFDFGLTRVRGYEAGEYSVELRTSDNTIIGGKQTLILKGDNPVVDRRSMAFNAKDPKVKKIEGYDAGSNQAMNDSNELPANNNAGAPGEVTPTGTATGFVPKEGLQETEEEKIKTKPGGCGCETVGARSPASALVLFLPIAAAGVVSYRRRRRA
ncbi:MAG: hypothetical protein KIT84_41960 [Labilithrix sp.]|nr:hypothetical protein [Labilithrix sp.]MCW5817640.1 hypothetical protein [Labilithrix sp.]